MLGFNKISAIDYLVCRYRIVVVGPMAIDNWAVTPFTETECLGRTRNLYTALHIINRLHPKAQETFRRDSI